MKYPSIAISIVPIRNNKIKTVRIFFKKDDEFIQYTAMKELANIIEKNIKIKDTIKKSLKDLPIISPPI